MNLYLSEVFVYGLEMWDSFSVKNMDIVLRNCTETDPGPIQRYI
jgi:hypothetical protein